MKHSRFFLIVILLLAAILVAPVAAQDAIVTNTPRGDLAVTVTEEPAATEIVTPGPTDLPDDSSDFVTQFIAWYKDSNASALEQFRDMNRWYIIVFMLLALVGMRMAYFALPPRYQRQLKQGGLDIASKIDASVETSMIEARQTPTPTDDLLALIAKHGVDKVTELLRALPVPSNITPPQQGRIHPLFAILLGAMLLFGAIGFASAQPRLDVQLLQNISFEQATDGLPDQWQGKHLTAKDVQICYPADDNQSVTGYCVMTLRAGSAKKVLYQDTAAIAEGTHNILFQAVVRGKNVQPGALKVLAKFYTGEGVVDKLTLNTKDGTYSWYDNYKGGLTAPAGGYTHARVQVIMKPGITGKIWFDAFNMSATLPE